VRRWRPRYGGPASCPDRLTVDRKPCSPDSPAEGWSGAPRFLATTKAGLENRRVRRTATYRPPPSIPSVWQRREPRTPVARALSASFNETLTTGSVLLADGDGIETGPDAVGRPVPSRLSTTYLSLPRKHVLPVRLDGRLRADRLHRPGTIGGAPAVASNDVAHNVSGKYVGPRTGTSGNLERGGPRRRAAHGRCVPGFTDRSGLVETIAWVARNRWLGRGIRGGMLGRALNQTTQPLQLPGGPGAIRESFASRSTG